MMTYLDLLTELQSFDDDDLLKVVTLYDTSRNEFSPIGVNFHETDSPYLTPVPYRGKPNSPAYTYYVAEKLAEIRNTSISEIAKVTTQNFNQLFFS